MNGAQFAAMVAAKKGSKDPVPAAIVAKVMGKHKNDHKGRHAAIQRRIQKGKIVDPDGIMDGKDEYRIVNGKKVPVKVGK